jgi:hypothetical protein
LFQRVFAMAASHSLLKARRVRRMLRSVIVLPLAALPGGSVRRGRALAPGGGGALCGREYSPVRASSRTSHECAERLISVCFH